MTIERLAVCHQNLSILHLGSTIVYPDNQTKSQHQVPQNTHPMN